MLSTAVSAGPEGVAAAEHALQLNVSVAI
jgi:hypothetical protein